ncbi:MAG: 3-isopropylmalate dehydratase [Burkholderiaceae bacterium]
MNLVYEGRCWKLGSDVSSDDLISARHVFQYDPQELRKHLLEGSQPAFAQEAKAGDLIVAGKRFAHGSQHTHPFLAMKAIGLGLLAQRLLRPPFRLAIYCGVPVLEPDDEALEMFNDGDRMRVNFETGQIWNLSSNRQINVPPLPDFLLRIIQAGGGLGYLAAPPTNPASMEASHDS